MEWFFAVLSLVFPTASTSYFLNFFKIKFSATEQVVLSLFLGQLFFVLSIFIFSFVLGFRPIVFWICLLGFVLIAIFAFKSKDFKRPRLSKGDTPLLLALFLFGIFFFVLLKRHMLPEIGGAIYTPHNTYGDMQYHLAIINSISLGGNFPPENPFLKGTRLAYPFLIDFYSAVLRTSGFSLQTSLVVSGLVFGVCLAGLFILLAKDFLQNNRQALLATLVFLFNGGLGGYILLKKVLAIGVSEPSMTESFTKVIDEYNFRFPNIISSVFMAERPILVGTAAFFLILLLLWRALNGKQTKSCLLLAGLVIGLLPLWHTHTVVALGIVIPFYCVIFLARRHLSHRAIGELLPLFFISLPLGLLGMLWHLPQVLSGSHFFGLDPGWVIGKEGWFLFWLVNLSIFPLLLLFSLLFLNKTQIVFYLPLLGLFIISNIFRFQPFDWDNYKILLLWYAFSSILVAKLLFVIKDRFPMLGKTVSTILSLFLVGSGMFLVIGDYITFYELFTKEDVKLSQWAQDNTKPDDVVLTAPKHNQFLILSGRSLLMGYPGYLWTQGINYSLREPDIKTMYTGDKVLMNSYNVKFVVVGPEERSLYSLNEGYFNREFEISESTKNYKIYKVF